MPASPILLAHSFNGKGGGDKLNEEEAKKLLKDDQLAWVHLDVNNSKTTKWLKDNITYLDPIIIEALLAQETRPRLEEFDEGMMLILRGVNLNQNADPEDMVSIRLWVDKHRIISLQRRDLKATRDIYKSLADGKGPKNAGDFVVHLAAKLVNRMQPMIDELDEKADDLEELIIESPDIKLRSDIIKLRKQSILFRRYLAPQKEVINRLRISEIKWFSKNNKRQLHENFDRVSRFVEELDTVRERSQIVQDELQNTLADKMNKNMYVLSVIASIFLPLGFLTGLLGINVGGIPGAENENSFIIFSIILIALVILQILFFKKMKWF